MTTIISHCFIGPVGTCESGLAGSRKLTSMQLLGPVVPGQIVRFPQPVQIVSLIIYTVQMVT